MPRTRRDATTPELSKIWRTAQYARLSRDDGDKPESNSIAGQKAMLASYIEQHSELVLGPLYVDDGYTGTNFDRPDFQRMIVDIEAGKIDCVLVKDLSRLGRNYLDVGQYVHRWFPEHGIRFIAINDNVDSGHGYYDMLVPVKNIFNEQYARDISSKVKSAFQTKQKQGAFIGAFSSYGYKKNAQDHNKLIVDQCAAPIVKRIFDLFESGVGKVKIAKILNEEKVPCPSEYKRQSGERYNNGRRLQNTTYWTYATIHRMLQNQMYIGNMEQGRSLRQTLHGKAKQLERDQWVVVEGTHEAIIDMEQWERVQTLLSKDTRALNFERNVSPFAGFLRCGDCERAMSKTNHPGGVYYCCGSYKRYGPTVCTRHGISQQEIETVVLEDLNHIISEVGNLKKMAMEALARPKIKRNLQAERQRCQGALERLYRLKKASYEDYREGLIKQEDFLKYKADYEKEEKQLTAQIERLQESEKEETVFERSWVKNLLEHGKIRELDRATLAETVEQILVFEDGRIEITYTFSDDLGILETKKEDAV